MIFCLTSKNESGGRELSLCPRSANGAWNRKAREGGLAGSQMAVAEWHDTALHRPSDQPVYHDCGRERGVELGDRKGPQELRKPRISRVKRSASSTLQRCAAWSSR